MVRDNISTRGRRELIKYIGDVSERFAIEYLGAVDNRGRNAFMHACHHRNLPFFREVYDRTENLLNVKGFDWNDIDKEGKSAYNLVDFQTAHQELRNKINDWVKCGRLSTDPPQPPQADA